MEDLNMICKFCGAEIQDDATFCTACGKSLAETVEGEVVRTVKPSKAPMVLGIISLVFSILAPFGTGCMVVPGVIAWITALVTGIVSNKIAKKKDQPKSRLTKAARIIVIVEAVLVALGILVSVGLTIAGAAFVLPEFI